MTTAISSCLVFDLYGTLLDIGAPVQRLSGRIGPKAPHLADLWRAKQLEYAWVATLTNQYETFWQITERGLAHALEALGLAHDQALANALLDAYTSPDVYPEVPAALRALRQEGHRLVVFSNGNPDMLNTALAAQNLTDLFDDAVSVDPVRLFKPHPSVYAHCAATLNEPNERIVFMSSNGWDITGASSFGWKTLWVNRKGTGFEFGTRPEGAVIRSLDDLSDRLQDMA